MSEKFDGELRDLGGGFLPPPPRFEFLYRIVVDCESPMEVGKTETGFKRIIPIVGGRFEGPELKGTVLPIGADWNTARIDDPGRRMVDTRYVLKTDDGELISLSTLGFSRRSKEAMSRREAGLPVDPSTYYFRQHLYFQTSSERYEWLNDIVAFGIVMSKFKGGPGVIYDAYCLR